jgi:hypothetical protein
MKQIIKNFNNIVKKTIFKVQNKTNNNFNISSFNKYLITFIGLLFVYLFYLLLPILYDKTWVQSNIESKLQNEFKINLNTSADISYRILPAPHFLIKDSKILVANGQKQKSIAEIKDLKVFLSQGNFFDQEKMNIKKLVINNANFSFLRNDLKLLDVLKSKKLSNKKIEINNSNIFFKDNLKNIISIIKVDKIITFFDDEKLLNFVNLKGEVFNIPFNFDFQYQESSNKYEKFYLSSKILRLKFFNESAIKDKLTSGKNIISILNSTINTKYNIKEKLIIFKSNNSRMVNFQLDYAGKLSINPFDLNLDIYMGNYKISKLFNINPVLIQFIKSGLLYNENISIKNSIIINSNEKKDLFQSAKINFNIVNGKFNLDNTTFVADNIGSLELSNSNLLLKNDNLTLNTNILFKVKNSEALFSFLNTSKKSRKLIKNILINLDYDFLMNEIKFNSVKIDNKDVNDQFLNAIEGFTDNDLNNSIKSKRLINKLFSIYEG